MYFHKKCRSPLSVAPQWTLMRRNVVTSTIAWHDSGESKTRLFLGQVGEWGTRFMRALLPCYGGVQYFYEHRGYSESIFTATLRSGARMSRFP